MRTPILLYLSFAFFLYSTFTEANPYPDPDRVPRDTLIFTKKITKTLSLQKNPGLACWRFLVNGHSNKIVSVSSENSCTPAFLNRARKKPKLGSYVGILKSQNTGLPLFYDSIGTGKEFLNLVSELNFRFPVASEPVVFELHAENSNTGIIEKVFEQLVLQADRSTPIRNDLIVKEIRAAKTSTPLKVNIYAEGYLKGSEEKFFKDAQKIVATFEKSNMPGQENFQFNAIFGVSNLKLGSPKNLGLPIPERDSFLGLYFPYQWNRGRWYHIVYPTRENKFREALAQWPYDYPIALVDSSGYWGVGNYKELTAIPSDNGSFGYLLLHEFGHFMGLNEEYNGGGPTELEFAKGIQEPWSQNISFQKNREDIKWRDLIAPSTPIPTSRNFLSLRERLYGAYVGGYADSGYPGQSHIPTTGCMMASGGPFCKVCSRAIQELIEQDK